MTSQNDRSLPGDLVVRMWAFIAGFAGVGADRDMPADELYLHRLEAASIMRAIEAWTNSEEGKS